MTIVVDIYGTRTIFTNPEPTQGQVLAWDSDSELFKAGDAASAVSNLKTFSLILTEFLY